MASGHPMSPREKTALLLVGAFALLCFAVSLIYQREVRLQQAKPMTPEEEARALGKVRRDKFAKLLQDGLRENGCRYCSVAAEGSTLIIANPGMAPIRIAATQLAPPGAGQGLQAIGFTHIKAVQGTNPYEEGFLYPVQ